MIRIYKEDIDAPNIEVFAKNNGKELRLGTFKEERANGTFEVPEEPDSYKNENGIACCLDKADDTGPPALKVPQHEGELGRTRQHAWDGERWRLRAVQWFRIPEDVLDEVV